MFNENETFSYSIEVAADIYKNIKTQQDANELFYKKIETFFKNIGKEFEELEGNGIAGFENVIYRNEEQSISVLVQFNNEPSVYGIILPTYGKYTEQLIEEGWENKCLFGLPIFTMQRFDEVKRVFIYFINRDSYLKFDSTFGRP